MVEKISFSGWQSIHHQTLESFRGKTVVISYSGGKDSSLLLNFFQQAESIYGFDLDVHGVAYPCHVFPKEEQIRLSLYWQDQGIDITWHNSRDGDQALDKVFKGQKSPCVVCSQLKKNVLYSYFNSRHTDWNNTVVVIGYTLWDLASAVIEHVLRQNFGGGDQGDFQGRCAKDRFLEIAQRFYPILEMENGLHVFKPLIRYNDTDIAQAVTDLNIPLTRAECRFKLYRPKRLLAEYYTLFGLNFSYEDVFAFARKAFDLPDQNFFQTQEISSFVSNMI
ncbi:hypothetical protein [uncultured Desulfobacter sp.]|uniref:hypothetical protein n=1 Tax=uncultured Desulfobacter sp. TaxID=240139 RepID=UPI002AAB6CCE|nr:hypothetical protein [uncultured Desulfobacter sp.]